MSLGATEATGVLWLSEDNGFHEFVGQSGSCRLQSPICSRSDGVACL